MKLLHLALRLAYISALIMICAIAISVMTHDAWLVVGHVAGTFSAIIAAGAVLALGVAALRGMARRAPPAPSSEGSLAPYEQGLTGLEPDADPQSSPANGPSSRRTEDSSG